MGNNLKQAPTLTRYGLAGALHEKSGLPRSLCARLVDDFIENASRALTEKGALKLASFGTFSVRSKTRRIGRNPRSGVEVMIAPRKVVSFRCSPLMRKTVNRNAG